VKQDRSHTARNVLAAVRLVNGAIGLLVPNRFIARFDPGLPPSAAATYAFRLFGIRTVLLGIDLFTLEGAELHRALREGVLIHASDTLTAFLLGVRGRVPRRTAVLSTLISTSNVALAVTALNRARAGKGRG
jgi:hypothetical protein